MSNTTQEASPRSTLASRLRALFDVDALWFGLLAVAFGLLGQSILTPGGWPSLFPDTRAATRWYALAIIILVIGWSGTYTNRRFLWLPAARVTAREWLRRADTRRRIALSVTAILLVAVGILVLRGDWFSRPGGLLWLAGLLLLLGAWANEPAEVDLRSVDTPPVERGWTLQVRTETAIVAAILIFAGIMRAWRLGDLSPGMHGDEGEAGSTALQILQGAPISPFERGWFNHSNIYFWTVSLFMRVFGTNLVGLRSFAVFCGLVTVLFVYLATRDMFGVRAAILAGCFIAFQSADVYFGRQLSSNAPFPALLAMMLYFLVHGLRTRRHLDFILAGFAAGFEVYYYAGGRLVPFMGFACLVYLALRNREFLQAYWTRALAYVLAAIAIAAPFAAYYLAYPLRSSDYPNDRFIWLHHDELAALYGTASWPAIVWDQLQRTLALITYNVDTSAIRILDYPIAQPLEAVLVVLGLAWALWRWRDTRFAILSIIFWISVVIGGVLTVDAPNVPRIMGVLVVMPILIAAVLDHFALLIASAARRLLPSGSPPAVGRLAASTALAAAVVIPGGENWHMYIDHFLNTHTSTDVTGQAAFVQRTGYAYHYYDLGVPELYWWHGDNRFLNRDAEGEDVLNPADVLPVVNNGIDANRPAAFMIWPPMYRYLSAIRAFYPGGREEVVHPGDSEHRMQPLIAYLVPSRVIEEHRVVRVAYQTADHVTVRGTASTIGLGPLANPPPGLSYPVHAAWSGDLMAPADDLYRFHAAAGARLTIDGAAVTTTGRTSVHLARGPHAVHFSVRLTEPTSPAVLQWSENDAPPQPVPGKLIWDGHIPAAWAGTITPLGRSTGGGPAVHVRDGFLGFRNAAQSLGMIGAFQGTWRTVLTITRPGRYSFTVNASGPTTFWLGRTSVVFEPAPSPPAQEAGGSISLRPGRYPVTVQYRSGPGLDYLELQWQQPGKPKQMMLGGALSAP
jgi:4-amino-4-deoxy-L-arabinose transferase-like glycosyltransferase